MLEAQVKAIEDLANKAGSLINEIKAKTDAEWEAVEKLTNAHKQIRSIETAKLRQGKLIE